MSIITVFEPVPDITGVVKNICILCDSVGEFEEGIPWEIKEDYSLDAYYLLSLMRDILKDPYLSPALLQVERDIYEIESSQWIFCLRQSEQGGAVWTDGVRQLEIEEYGIVHCGNGMLEPGDGCGGLYMIFW
ncbi:hypothetical protein AtubIFM54640_010323 [Aspergillus tubingensis]|nr:hypothetical protein AtubIFM54640_010323 [Aspergillus tubingensis]